MISLLARVFLRKQEESARRTAYGILCGAVGVFLNAALFAGKLLAGWISGSIAVMADAFNNLSDAGSSVVTMLGFRLAEQEPDRNHPFGHGRFEYLSGLVVAMLIILMGAELLKSSVGKILHPQGVEATPLVIGILCVSVAVKGYMVCYNRRIGRALASAAMEATARDSLCDAVATLTVLASTVLQSQTGWQIDGWAGVLVAVFIIWSGIDAARSTINPLLGTPPSPELVEKIQEIVLSHEKVVGAHDLIVHDYGPGRMMISLHAEVPASEDVMVLHDVIDQVEEDLRETLGCEAVIHMDPVVTDDGITAETRCRVEILVRCIDEAISIHGFRWVPGPECTDLVFDVVVPYAFRLTDEEVTEKICAGVQALDEKYRAVIRVERSYT